MEKVIFIDRDGTINEEVNYLYKPEDFSFIPRVPEAIRHLRELGFKIIVVTNQAGVARGYYSEEQVLSLHQYLNDQLQVFGTYIDHFFYCPHHPLHGIGEYRRDCDCRKPHPGMLVMGERFYEIDKNHSYMIGDKLADVEAGKNYGVKSILVGSGYGCLIHREICNNREEPPYDFYAETLMDAARWIEAGERKEHDEGR